MLRRPVGPAASLSNPANVEYEVVRTTLVPGALKTLAYNKSISHKDGVKLFEISDVVLRCDNEIGARNARRLVALHAGKNSAFEIIHGEFFYDEYLF
jgi:phenylalanyl-tRNA synthetase beta chain